MRWLFIIVIVILPVLEAQAQDEEEMFSRLFNEIFISPDELNNLEEAYQQLYRYYLRPMNLNKISSNELRELLFISDQQIDEIIGYREKSGPFVSIYELQAIQSLSLQELKLLSVFVTVNEDVIRGEPNNYMMVRYERDLQVRKGYKPTPEAPDRTPYLGTPDKVLLRVRSAINNKMSFGFSTEKDAGENLILDRKTNRYGFDYYSGYFLYQGNGALDKLVIGDYKLQFGQGLVYSSGFALGKAAGDISGFRRVTTGIRPYTSSLESGYLRGLAGTVQYKNISLTGFASYNNIDVSMDGANSFTGFDNSGFHRTKNEVGGKDNLTEKQAGLVVNYEGLNVNAGLGFSSIQLGALWKREDRLYNLNSFSGDQLNTAFGFLSYRWKNLNIFTENAFLFEGGLAHLAGTLVNLSSNMETGIIYRNYQPGFISLYGNALGEKSTNSNEKGLLWVLNYKYRKRLQLALYFDKFSFPWLSYQISRPDKGYEYMFRLRYNLSRSSYFLLQYKEEEKGQDVENNYLKQVYPERKQNYQLVIHYPVNERFTFRTRVQGSKTTLNAGSGVAMLQDVYYSHRKYSIKFRYAIFDTDNFDNRQYVYENDVLYAFSFPALQGKGTRYYVVLKYNVSKKLKIWGRYSQTFYTDRNEISSGNELIEGNRLSEVKLQAMYKF